MVGLFPRGLAGPSPKWQPPEGLPTTEEAVAVGCVVFWVAAEAKGLNDLDLKITSSRWDIAMSPH